MYKLFTIIIVAFLSNTKTVLSEEWHAKLFTPLTQVCHQDKTLRADCLMKCALSATCVGSSMVFTNQTCNYFDGFELTENTAHGDVLYRKRYPPPPTCQNGGFWGDTSKTYCNCQRGFAGTFCERYIFDCSEGFSLGATESGVYTVQPRLSPVPFQTYCELRWGGRTYIQKQEKGINFYRSWQEYRDGFGDLNGDHWLGLQKIKELCNSNPCRLLVRLNYNSQPKWVQGFFHNFNLTNETDGYRLLFSHMSVSGNSKNQLDDGLNEIKGAKFSTYDRDNDDNPNDSCAMIHYSGWWFKNCAPSNLNGRLKPILANSTGTPEVIFWPGDTRGVSGVSMSLRLYH